MSRQIDIDNDPEQKARLHGLIAVLGLPLLRAADGTFKRVRVEIEVAKDLWEPVDGLSIESDRFVFYFGANGARVERVFRRTEGLPRWRMPKADEPSIGLGDAG